MKPKKPAQGGPRGQRTSGTGKARSGGAAAGRAAGTRGSGSGSGTRSGGTRSTSGASFSSRGAGRTGRVNAPGAPPTRKSSEKSLGGEQVEGRQAVRELLIAGKRKVRELWVSGELVETEIIGDIVEIARSMRVQVTEVARKRLEAQARSEAPQGILAFADPLEEVELGTLDRKSTRLNSSHRT